MRHALCAAALAGFIACAATAAGKPADQAAPLGKRLFDYHCASCHGTGIGNPGAAMKPGTDALRVKYGGELPALLSERTDLTPKTVAYFVRNGVSVMAPYRKTEIDDAQLAALGTWLSRNNPDLKRR